jgi:hypothetical protein
VTWTKLLANKDAQKHKTSKKELDNIWALIARDLAEAALVGLSAGTSPSRQSTSDAHAVTSRENYQ